MIRDRYSQAWTHARLARMTTDEQRIHHLRTMNHLATQLDIPGLHDRLGALADGA
jgi:hypothetical protein